NPNYLIDPAILKEALDDYEAILAKYGDGGPEGFYFILRSEQELKKRTVFRVTRSNIAKAISCLNETD
ncbi:MAG: hypothetical protein M0T83_06930, partial [Nitrospiraceae bacterium]|nr:hypothetical protein [Nitrospiraceae bacterium]